MKKLLGILGAIAFTASVSSTVVACGTSSSSDNNHLSSIVDWGKDGNAIVMTLADGTVIREKDFLTKDTGLDKYLLNQLNGMIANKYAQDYNNNTITNSSSTNLGLVSKDNNFRVQGDTKTNGYEDEINNFNFVSLSTNLYQQYVNSLLQVTPFDESDAVKAYPLNPVWYGNDFNNSREYSLWFKDTDGTFKRWTTVSETDQIKLKQNIGKQYLPDSKVLSGSNFYLVKDEKLSHNDKLIDDISSLTSDEATITKAAVNATPMTGQQALLYRFQSYLQSQGDSSMQNALVMEYAKNSLYKMQQKPVTNADPWETATNKSLYIDSSSRIAKDIQSWPTKNTDKVTSSYKMVWRISVDPQDVDAVNAAIQDATNGLINGNSKLTNNNFAVFKQGELIDSVFTAIKGAAKNTVAAKSMFQKGADPFFGEDGYQGIVKDGKVVDGGSLNLNSTVAGNIANTEGFGILQNTPKNDGTRTFDFAPANGNNRDYVIVMPLYLMDLLRDYTAPAKADAPVQDSKTLNNVAINNWVELNPQVGNDFSSSDSFSGGDFTEFKPTDDTKNVIASGKNYFMTYNKKTYVIINDTSKASLKIHDNTKNADITINPAKDTSATDQSGYGIKGIFENPNSKDDKANAFNGQEITYKIRLGLDNKNPNSYEQDWVTTRANQAVADVNQLTNAKKTDMMDTLLALATKDDTALQEETKNSVYKSYISLDDIYYKGLYDEISKYLKEDDNTDESD